MLHMPFALITPQPGGGGGSWTPASLTTQLQRWYDASDTGSITIGTGVSQWNDLSGNAKHLTQATGGNQPGYTSATSIDFEGGSTRRLDASSWSSQYDIYVVLTTNSSNSDFRVGFMAAEQILIFNTGQNLFGTWQSGFKSSAMSVATSTKALIRVSMDASKNVSMNLNGGTMTGTITTMPGSVAIVSVGGESTASRQVGKIHEIVVSDNLGSTDQQKTEGYLAWKWGLQASLPGGHPYSGAAP